MEAWPSAFPAPRQAYRLAVSAPVATSQFEAGPPLQRLRFDDEIDYVNVQWRFTDYQHALFKQWFAIKIKYGTKKFTMDLQLSDVDGWQSYECGFHITTETNYQSTYVPDSHLWDVSAVLFVENVSLLDEATLQILLDNYPDEGAPNFISSIDRLDDFVEVRLASI